MKCKKCAICKTSDYKLIRNCELRGGRWKDCEANRMPHVVADKDAVIDWQELRTTTGASKP